MVGILQAANGGASLLPNAPSAQSVLFDQIRAKAAERFVFEKDAIDSAAKARTEALDSESDRVVNVKAQINNAKLAVESGQEAIATVRQKLLEIRTSVYLAAEPDEDQELRAGEFDGIVRTINSEADTGGRAFSLVGYIDRTDYTPNSIEYRKDLGFGVSTLQGTYIGTDWRVEAADGTVWVPNLETETLTNYKAVQGEVLKTTLSDGSPYDKTTSTRNGITLTSYDATTNAITFEVTFDPEQPPEVVTGTLKQTGLGLMGSWFYEKLATGAGRQAAYAAIDKAEIELVSRESTLQIAAGRVSTDSRKADEMIADLSKQKVEVLTEQLTKTEKLQMTTAQQIQAMMVNLDSLSQQQQNYINAFAGFVQSPFLRLNLTV